MADGSGERDGDGGDERRDLQKEIEEAARRAREMFLRGNMAIAAAAAKREAEELAAAEEEMARIMARVNQAKRRKRDLEEERMGFGIEIAKPLAKQFLDADLVKEKNLLPFLKLKDQRAFSQAYRVDASTRDTILLESIDKNLRRLKRSLEKDRLEVGFEYDPEGDESYEDQRDAYVDDKLRVGRTEAVQFLDSMPDSLQQLLMRSARDAAISPLLCELSFREWNMQNLEEADEVHDDEDYMYRDLGAVAMSMLPRDFFRADDTAETRLNERLRQFQEAAQLLGDERLKRVVEIVDFLTDIQMRGGDVPPSILCRKLFESDLPLPAKLAERYATYVSEEKRDAALLFALQRRVQDPRNNMNWQDLRNPCEMYPNANEALNEDLLSVLFPLAQLNVVPAYANAAEMTLREAKRKGDIRRVLSLLFHRGTPETVRDYVRGLTTDCSDDHLRSFRTNLQILQEREDTREKVTMLYALLRADLELGWLSPVAAANARAILPEEEVEEEEDEA